MLSDMTGRTVAFLRALALGAALAFTGVEPCLAASGEFADKAATALAIFIIIALPIGGITIFWLVHVLPEKIAEKRHHPQKDAIHVLCLLSLVFGGLLWPLAWLWAYSKPVLYKLAYGTDKHEDSYAKGEVKADAGAPGVPVHEELGRLRRELEEVEKRGELPDAMKGIRKRLAALESRVATEGEG
jgi:CBS domain containing-hemolysin-like protein